MESNMAKAPISSAKSENEIKIEHKKRIPRPRHKRVTIKNNPLNVSATEYIALFSDAVQKSKIKKEKRKEAQ